MSRENLSIYAVHAHEQIKVVKGKFVKENLIVCAWLILRLASGNPALGSAYEKFAMFEVIVQTRVSVHPLISKYRQAGCI